MSYTYRKFQPATDTLKPFDCGDADLNDFLVETSTTTPNAKRRSSYPPIKVGRLAVSSKAQCSGLGREILAFLKAWYYNDPRAGCRFITVDALRTAEEFYGKCRFKPLVEAKPEDETILMFYDMLGIGPTL